MVFGVCVLSLSVMSSGFVRVTVADNILLYGCAPFSYPLICWCTWGLFLPFGSCEWCCCEHSGPGFYLSHLLSVFSGVYT